MTRLIIFGCLGMALFGYDTGIVSGAIVLLREDIALTTADAEIVVSITMVCAAVSTGFGIPANSIFGRKPVIMGSSVLYIVGSVIVAVATSFKVLVIGRALLGLAIGFASGTVPMYSAELSPPDMRGMIVTLNDLNIVFGQLLAALMNLVFRHVASGWRWSMGLAAVPAVVMFIGFMTLPESPRWLVMKGRLVDARAALARLNGEDENIDQLMDNIVESLGAGGSVRENCKTWASPMKQSWQNFRDIWFTKNVRRASILGISLMALNQLSGINTVMYYSTTILIDAGFSVHASMQLSAMCAGAQLFGVCISVASMDSVGRRPTALRSCLGVVVTLLLLSISFLCSGQFWDYVKVFALASYLIAFGSGLSGVPWVMNAEIYPLKLRSEAVGQATIANWLFNYLVGRYFLSVCETIGTGGAFSIFAGLSVVGGVWLYFMLPETMHLSLEDIASLFENPYPKIKRQSADSGPRVPVGGRRIKRQAIDSGSQGSGAELRNF